MCIHQRDLPKKKPCTMKTENDNRATKEFYDEISSTCFLFFPLLYDM